MHWSPEMVLDFASSGKSHRFGRHSVPVYLEACHGVGGGDFNDRMDRARYEVTVQSAGCIKNGGGMVVFNVSGPGYREQYLRTWNLLPIVTAPRGIA
jgi:hypothetical protein